MIWKLSPDCKGKKNSKDKCFFKQIMFWNVLQSASIKVPSLSQLLLYIFTVQQDQKVQH